MILYVHLKTICLRFLKSISEKKQSEKIMEEEMKQKQEKVKIIKIRLEFFKKFKTCFKVKNSVKTQVLKMMKTYASLPNQEAEDGIDTSAPKNYSENLKGLNRIENLCRFTKKNKPN